MSSTAALLIQEGWLSYLMSHEKYVITDRDTISSTFELLSKTNRLLMATKNDHKSGRSQSSMDFNDDRKRR